MKMGKRLLCVGAAFSILCSSVVFGEEVVPPNPLSGGLPAASGTLGQGPGGTANGQTIGNVTVGGLPASGGTGAVSGSLSPAAGRTRGAAGSRQRPVYPGQQAAYRCR